MCDTITTFRGSKFEYPDLSSARMGSQFSRHPDLLPTSYNMSHQRRGEVLIFCHTDFTDKHGTAKPKLALSGYQVDANALRQTLVGMGWNQSDIRIKNNPTLLEIDTEVSALAGRDHTDADCAIVVVLTHGNKNGYLIDSECTGYNESRLWKRFIEERDRTPIESSLTGKPKILITQACRGGQVKLNMVLYFTLTNNLRWTGEGCLHLVIASSLNRRTSSSTELLLRTTYHGCRTTAVTSYGASARCVVLLV